MPREKLAARIERGVTELERLIRTYRPEAELVVHPRIPGRIEVVLDVFAEFDDPVDLTEIISERRADLFAETGLLFIPVAQPYDERPSLKQQQSA